MMYHSASWNNITKHREIWWWHIMKYPVMSIFIYRYFNVTQVPGVNQLRQTSPFETRMFELQQQSFSWTIRRFGKQEFVMLSTYWQGIEPLNIFLVMFALLDLDFMQSVLRLYRWLMRLYDIPARSFSYLSVSEARRLYDRGGCKMMQNMYIHSQHAPYFFLNVTLRVKVDIWLLLIRFFRQKRLPAPVGIYIWNSCKKLGRLLMTTGANTSSINRCMASHFLINNKNRPISNSHDPMIRLFSRETQDWSCQCGGCSLLRAEKNQGGKHAPIFWCKKQDPKRNFISLWCF